MSFSCFMESIKVDSLTIFFFNLTIMKFVMGWELTCVVGRLAGEIEWKLGWRLSAALKSFDVTGQLMFRHRRYLSFLLKFMFESCAALKLAAYSMSTVRSSASMEENRDFTAQPNSIRLLETRVEALNFPQNPPEPNHYLSNNESTLCKYL